MKANKSFLKRLRITRNGLALARRPGKNHFNAKERRVTQLRGKRLVGFRLRKKVLSRLMS